MNIFLWMLLLIFHSEPDRVVAAVRISSVAPMQTTSGTAIIHSSYDIYYAQRLTMYRIGVDFDSSVNNKPLIRETRFRYFVFSNDSLYGLEFNNEVDLSGNNRPARRRVDSVKNENNNVFTTFGKERKPDSVYSGQGEKVKMFRYPPTKGCPEAFTFFYYYSKTFLQVRETFTPDFDTSDGLKLYKIVIDAKGGYYPKFGATLLPREYVYEMTGVPATDLQTAEKYFQQYRNFSK